MSPHLPPPPPRAEVEKGGVDRSRQEAEGGEVLAKLLPSDKFPFEAERAAKEAERVTRSEMLWLEDR